MKIETLINIEIISLILIMGTSLTVRECNNQNVLLNKRKEVIVISIVTDFDIVDNILISFHVCRYIVILILLLLQGIWSHVFQSISYEKLPYTVLSQ